MRVSDRLNLIPSLHYPVPYAYTLKVDGNYVKTGSIDRLFDGAAVGVVATLGIFMHLLRVPRCDEDHDTG